MSFFKESLGWFRWSEAIFSTMEATCSLDGSCRNPEAASAIHCKIERHETQLSLPRNFSNECSKSEMLAWVIQSFSSCRRSISYGRLPPNLSISRIAPQICFEHSQETIADRVTCFPRPGSGQWQLVHVGRRKPDIADTACRHA